MCAAIDVKLGTIRGEARVCAAFGRDTTSKFFLLLLLVLLSQNLINSCQPIVVVAVASFGANEKGAKLRGHVFRIFDNSINYVSVHIINGTSKRKLLNWISHSFK